jgi:glycosyltransferase involved in cell wall biosynthesis
LVRLQSAKDLDPLGGNTAPGMPVLDRKSVQPMRIAMFYHAVIKKSAIGALHLRLLEATYREHDFTVFSILFENPCPERIRWVRVPIPKRPAALTFLAFHLVAPLCYWWHRFRRGVRFDVVQFVSSDLSFGDISSAHFCNRAYLQRHWKESQSEGVRRLSHWALYRLGALTEPLAYRRARLITACSLGLKREIEEEYPFAHGKIRICHNGVNVRRMQRPADFNREQFRSKLGLTQEDIVLSFTALGAFERKGLPLLLEGLSRVDEPRLKLVVVGGLADMVSRYRRRATNLGLGGRVILVGSRDDVRPYLWATDAFAFPSHYEAFPLAVLEAAAARLPLIVTDLNGVDEFLRDGMNGILIAGGSAGDVQQALTRFLKMSAQERRGMGTRARDAASYYSMERFVSSWRDLYEDFRTSRTVSGNPRRDLSIPRVVCNQKEQASSTWHPLQHKRER